MKIIKNSVIRMLMVLLLLAGLAGTGFSANAECCCSSQANKAQSHNNKADDCGHKKDTCENRENICMCSHSASFYMPEPNKVLAPDYNNSYASIEGNIHIYIHAREIFHPPRTGLL